MPILQTYTYKGATATDIYGGMTNLAFLVPSGSIKSISKNNRTSIDPMNDPLANPNYPGVAPWDFHGGIGWSHVSDYCGAVFAGEHGVAGTLLQYGGAGHSASQATMWAGFDIATQTWKRVGRRPLPNPAITGTYSINVTPPSSQFDHSTGKWIGASNDWLPAFRQPGYNPPAGGHTRASMVYRPPSKAGNLRGQILMGIDTTGGLGELPGNNPKTDHHYNLDTEFFTTANNDRPGFGAAAGNKVYDSVSDKVLGWNYVSSAFASEVHVLDCATMIWSKITGLTNSPYLQVDAGQAFICGGLLMVADQRTGQAAFTLYAIPISGLLSGANKAWTQLTISGTDWPSKNGETVSIQWQLCPLNNCFYAVNRVTGSNKLFKLTPPGLTDSANLAGAWTLSSETLSGEGLNRTDWHYNRLQWVPALKSFIFIGEDITATVQGIRPIGI